MINSLFMIITFWGSRILNKSIAKSFVILAMLSSISLVLLMLGFAIALNLPQQATTPVKSIQYNDVATLMGGGVAPPLTQNLHGLPGYEGYDYGVDCEEPIYSPVPGVGIVTFNGLDGYRRVTDTGESYPESTMLVIEGPAGKATLLHGVYIVHPGDTVIGGESLVGVGASIGWSTGCHQHLIWKHNPQHLPLRLTWYDPALCASGNKINCDSDPTKFSTMIDVTEDRYGRSAACIPPWTNEQITVNIPGVGVFDCIDKGGGIVANGEYISIDILSHEPIAESGSLVYGWYLTK